jgi:hypothetical protein
MRMLKRLRNSARIWALLVLGSFTALGTLSTAHSVCSDELSITEGTGHFPGSHVLKTAQPREAPTHCALCHWMQSFRGGRVRASGIVTVDRHVAAPPRIVVHRTRAAARLALPPRAPPA